MASEIAALLPSDVESSIRHMAARRLLEEEEEKHLMSSKRSQSFMEAPQGRRNQLIATMPSIQNEIEEERKRSRSIDLSSEDLSSEEEKRLTYHEETMTFLLTDKPDYLVVKRITPEEMKTMRENNRKKGISRDLLLDRYESAKELKRSFSEPLGADSLSESSSTLSQQSDEGMSTRVLRMIRSNLTHERYDLVKWLPEAVDEIGKNDILRVIIPYLPKFAKDKLEIKRELLNSLWPFCKALLQQCNDDEAQIVYPPILELLQDFLVDPAQKIKERACDVVLQLASLMSQEDCSNYVLRSLIELSHNETEEQGRITALELFNQLAFKMGQATCEQFLSFEFIAKVDDPSHRIRRAAALNLMNVAATVSQDFFIDKLYPIYLTLSIDNTWGVRKAAVECLPDISKLCPMTIRATELVDLFEKFAKDSNKWVKVAALQYLGQFIASLQRAEYVSPLLIDYYLSMGSYSSKLVSKNDVIYFCAFNFPAVLQTLGPKGWPSLRKLYFQLVKSTQWKVRRTIACSLHEIANILGPQLSEEELIPVLNSVLKDLTDVRIGALTHLPAFLEAMRPEKRNQFLDMIQDLQNEPEDWRMRSLLARQVKDYSTLFEAEKVFTVLTPILLKHCNDAVTEVRLGAADSVYKILEVLESSPFFFNSVVNNLKVMAKSTTFKNRQTFLHICANLMKLPQIFVDYFLDCIFTLHKDKVANVRITCATLLRNYEKETQGEGQLMKYLHPMIERLEKDINKEVRFIMNGAHLDIPPAALIDPRQPEQSSMTLVSTGVSDVSFGEVFQDEVKVEERTEKRQEDERIIESLVLSMIDSIVEEEEEDDCKAKDDEAASLIS